jgi:hypothetical protein
MPSVRNPLPTPLPTVHAPAIVLRVGVLWPLIVPQAASNAGDSHMWPMLLTLRLTLSDAAPRKPGLRRLVLHQVLILG